MKQIYLSLCIFCISILGFSQAKENESDVARIVDDLVGIQELDVDYEEVYENLMQYLSHPIDLNEANAEELRQLYILSEQQIAALMNHRKTEGSLLNLYELQSIPEFNAHVIETLLPFVQVKDPNQKIDRSFLRRMVSSKNSYVIMRYDRSLEKRQGTDSEQADRKFLGSPDKLYMRVRSSKPGDYSVGITAEKDPGEQLRWQPSAYYFGADFLSAHIQLKNKRRIRNLIIGDYQCQFGQGLMLGSAFGLGKGGETISTVRKSNVGFVPYSSANESGFYRGAAATFQLTKKVSVSGFYSRTLRDATLQNDDSTNLSTSAFQYTGFHRTIPEFLNRKQVTEKSFGAVVQFTNGNVDAGIMMHEIEFDIPIERKPSVYNQFVFEGTTNINGGAYINASINNVNMFAEVSKSFNGGMAVVGGVLASLHSKFDVSIIYRKYDRNYYGFYVNAFGESSQPQNETGVYWGWKYRINKKYTLSSYLDLFRFPWLGFRRYAPSFGHEWLARAQYQPTKKILMFVQAREEVKARNVSTEANLYQQKEVLKRNFWLVFNYQATDYVKLKTRVQWSSVTFDSNVTEGLVLSQDLSFSVWKLEVSGRYALFSTDDFDNRQYSYENDAFMAFSLPSYYGIGIRNFLMLEFKASKSFSLWVRYARTRYTDREEIGSGLDLIKGNIRNDIKLQALLRF